MGRPQASERNCDVRGESATLGGANLAKSAPSAEFLKSWPDDYLTGPGRQAKLHTALLVDLKCRGNIQLGDLDLSCPRTAAPIVCTRKQGWADDRVVLHRFL